MIAKKALSRPLSLFAAALLLALPVFFCIPGGCGLVSCALALEDEPPFSEDDAVHCPRQYITNGQPGYVTVYETPGSELVLGYVANNGRFTGSHLYDGWTLAVDSEGERLGWVRLSETCVLPDAISFEEKYGGAFLSFDEAIGEDPLDFSRAFTRLDISKVKIYSYPGSAEVLGDVNAQTFWSNDSPEESYTQFYRDSQGRLWFPYSSLHHPPFCSGWICLSDPGNANLPADPAVTFPEPEVIPPAEQLPPAPVYSFPYRLRDWHVAAAAAAVLACIALVRRALKRRALRRALEGKS